MYKEIYEEVCADLMDGMYVNFNASLLYFKFFSDYIIDLKGLV